MDRKGIHRIRRASKLFVSATLIIVGSCMSIAWASGVTSSAAPQAAKLPHLLKMEYSYAFAVRPGRIDPTVDGGMFIGGRTGMSSHIHWQTWNKTKAYAVATLWINDGIPSMAEGTFHPYRATVRAFRVRNMRFTRLTVRYRQDGKAQVWAMKLVKSGNLGYAWN